MKLRSFLVRAVIWGLTAAMNKLVFFDGESNAEIGVFREWIIVNFKHNVPGFLLMAFGDDDRR
jgi:hypothetical protein